MNDPLKIEAERMQAWVSFLHAHARILRQLAKELELADQVSLDTYDVLVQLSEAGGALRHRDLLEHLVISQPGLSRKVERMATAGLVERQPDPQDGRGVVVKLTRTGRAALRSAARVHMAGIDREFAARLTDDEAATLAAVFGRLVDAPEEPAPSGLQQAPSSTR